MVLQSKLLNSNRLWGCLMAFLALLSIPGLVGTCRHDSPQRLPKSSVYYTIYYTLYTIYYILYTIYYNTIYYILYTFYYILSTIYYILHTIYYILYTIYYILYTIYYILYYTILYYTILYYTILYYTILYYTVILYSTILYSTLLYYTVPYYTILYSCTENVAKRHPPNQQCSVKSFAHPAEKLYACIQPGHAIPAHELRSICLGSQKTGSLHRDFGMKTVVRAMA